MQTFDMKAERRKKVGSSSSRVLRADGRIPAVLCGRGGESVALHVDAKEFEAARKQHARIITLQVDGQPAPAVLHDVSYDVLSQEPAHIDFQRIDMHEKIEIAVSIRTKGPAKGELEGGVLTIQMDEITVRCLPLEIPDSIEVDIRELPLHGTLHVRDVKLPAGLECTDEPGALVLNIVEKKEVAVPVAGAVEAGPAEPELIQKAPKTDEEAAGAEAGKDAKEKKPEKK